MALFFPELLHEFISADFLENVRKKFHFEAEQTAQIRTVAEKMLPTIREEAFYNRQMYSMEQKSSLTNSDTAYECVAMSLGNGVDLLQESYGEKGLLLQSYMIEVLASELLIRGYNAYNNDIMEHSAKHVARYYFPGSEETLPLEVLPELLKNLTSKITCNDAFCMQPQKSVVFIAELTQDDAVNCQGICVGCTNKSCPNRMEKNNLIKKRMTDLPLTYGYSRIFGNHA